MKNLCCLAVLVCIVSGGHGNDKEQAKEGLRSLQEFIGSWKGSGGPLPPKRPSASDPIWSEKFEWGWNFKGDISLTLKVENGRHIKEGSLKFVPSKKNYELTLVDPKGGKRTFEGEIDGNYLRFQRTDPETKEVQKLTMNTAAEGVRFVYTFERKPEGRTLFVKEYQVAATKEGESLGKTEKKNECVVSGGVATTPVTYKGETFYVCCSGCREEFNANPEKYVKEFKAKKGK